METKKYGNKVKATLPSTGEVYFAYIPEKINKNYEWEDPRINTLLEQARGYLGELNAYSKLVPNVDYFIKSHIAVEAEKTSMLEGTKTTLEEIYMDPSDIGDTEKVSDQEEVLNYIKATNYSVEKILSEEGLPLSNRLVREAHEKLLDGVRGNKRKPGIVRTVQNKIGGSNTSLKDAVFIPPTPDVLPVLLDDLQNFWHNSELEIPDLIKVALAHYQFETIHPFEDGNGRIGRLIIVLQLISCGLLNKPTLYLSDYFEKNRASYYDALSRVRESDDMEQWVRFFLVGVAETSKKGRDTLEKIIDLRAKYEKLIEVNLGVRSQRHGKELLVKLFEKPVVTVKDIESMISVTTPTANVIAKAFLNAGIFVEKTGYERNRIFVLHEYLGLFNS